MTKKPCFITSQEEYEEKLAEVERLIALDPENDTIDGIRLKYLADQVDRYEKQNYFVEERRHKKAEEIRDAICDYLARKNNLAFWPKRMGNPGHLKKIIKRHL